ncbi:MAG: hypothetical protein ACK5LC_10880, partial [Coprobacillaceae bacterium]
MKVKVKGMFLCLLMSGLVLGLTSPTLIKANEVEGIKEENVEEDKIELEGLTTDIENIQATNLEIVTYTRQARSTAPVDWAFNENSKPLNDAIVNHATYGTIDANGDGYISITEAATYTGSINLSSQGITGTLEGIQCFSTLKQLQLQGNNLTGELPLTIGNMSSLSLLYLANNQLTGSLPTSMGEMNSLLYVQLHNNQLTGSIPSELGNLSSLKTLYLNGNQLSGTIPTTLGHLEALTGLYLNGNQLTGSIPKEI